MECLFGSGNTIRVPFLIKSTSSPLNDYVVLLHFHVCRETASLTNRSQLLRYQTLQKVECVSVWNELELVAILVDSDQESMLVDSLDDYAHLRVVLSQHVHVLVGVKPLSVVTVQEWR